MWSINSRPDLEELLEVKEHVIFEKLDQETLEAVEEDGTAVIILGPTSMHQSHSFLQQALPVSVIDPGLIGYKLCEIFLETGLSHSKTAFPAPQQPDDEFIVSRIP